MKSKNTPQKRLRVQISFAKSPSLTKQYFKDECDINNVVNKFAQTGQIPNLNNMEPQYGNSPDMDLKTALDSVFELKAEFANLTTQEKAQFSNNPEIYAQFLSDYAQSPESFYFDETLEDDIPLSKTPEKATQEPAEPSDEG